MERRRGVLGPREIKAGFHLAVKHREYQSWIYKTVFLERCFVNLYLADLPFRHISASGKKFTREINRNSFVRTVGR